jgi:hypothetical protein
VDLNADRPYIKISSLPWSSAPPLTPVRRGPVVRLV